MKREGHSGSSSGAGEAGWLLVYDGDCSLCRRSVARVARLDWLDRVEAVSLADDETLAVRAPGLRREDLLRELHLIGPDGRIYRGFLGFRRLARLLPALWVLVPLLHLPGAASIGRAVYARVAGSRHRDGEV